MIILNSPNIVGHSNFLEPTLILIKKISMGHINYPPTLSLRSCRCKP